MHLCTLHSRKRLRSAFRRNWSEEKQIFENFGIKCHKYCTSPRRLQRSVTFRGHGQILIIFSFFNSTLKTFLLIIYSRNSIYSCKNLTFLSRREECVFFQLAQNFLNFIILLLIRVEHASLHVFLFLFSVFLLLC